MASKKPPVVRDKILDCAEILFGKEGFKGTSVREIAEAAKCNQAMIHYYFGNKDNLYIEVFRFRWMPKELRVIQKFKDSIKQLKDPTPSQLIEAYVRAYVDRSLTDSEKHTQRLLIVREIATPGEAFKLVSEQINKPITKIFLHHMSKYLAEGISEAALTLNILSIYGMVYYFTYSHNMVVSVTDRKYTPEFKEELIRSIVDFSLQGLPLKGKSRGAKAL